MSPVWILLTLLPILGGAQRFNCKGRILGAYYADAKSGCKAFHVCVRVAGGGIRDFRFFCPPGTLFHQEAQTCTDWGDDDPLACPADIYDGQFDLYRIGSGFDTKKLSKGNRDEEAEFGLQRAETGDRRLSQNSVASNRPESDLRAAHSSDFFSGQRDRGRDESFSTSSTSTLPPTAQTNRQSFRRTTTSRPSPSTLYNTPVSSPAPQPSKRPRYDGGSKRKLVRKRPIYVSTKAPLTTPPSISTPQQNYPEPQQQKYQTPQQNYSPQQNFNQQKNYNVQLNRRIPYQNKEISTTTPNVPPQYQEYKDEYVEVSRVSPKQQRFYPQSVSSTPFPQPTNTQRYNKNDGLVQIYNYDTQSTPGANTQKENQAFKLKNTFNVADTPREPDFQRIKNVNINIPRDTSTTTEYINPIRHFPTTTAVYKNYNSVSYEPEKNNFVSYSKQNNNYPSSTVTTTTIYTTPRSNPHPNLNTVAYNTNIAFNAQTNTFPLSDEDDGQYHPPEGEDDGLYRPEIYDRELLSGAHSLNIAASGNRLPEERKKYSKSQAPRKPVAQTAVPRPFKPAPISNTSPTTRAPETFYTTTSQSQTVNTQRTFDYFQTYTTTSRPADFLELGSTFAPANELPTKAATTIVPRVEETRPTRAPQASSTQAPRRPPHFAQPVNKKEDNSYDYAYYDSDPGFSEYDQIEEFGKTNKQKRS